MEMRKSKKFTSKQQFLMLLAEIKKYPQLGKGPPVFSGDKRRWNEGWERIRRILNSVGPPMRSTTEWKKIWADLKMRSKKRFEENASEIMTSLGDPISDAQFQNSLTFIDNEVNEILGFTDNLSKRLGESFIAVKTQKPTHMEMNNDGALTEFQFASPPSPVSPVLLEPCIAVSKAASPSVSTAASASNAAVSAISAAVFNAVSVAASAAASTLASTAALADGSTSESTTAKQDVSSSKHHKGQNDEYLGLLRQQVGYQHNICKSLDQIASAVELYVSNSIHRQAVEAVTELPDLV